MWSSPPPAGAADEPVRRAPALLDIFAMRGPLYSPYETGYKGVVTVESTGSQPAFRIGRG